MCSISIEASMGQVAQLEFCNIDKQQAQETALLRLVWFQMLDAIRDSMVGAESEVQLPIPQTAVSRQKHYHKSDLGHGVLRNGSKQKQH